MIICRLVIVCAVGARLISYCAVMRAAYVSLGMHRSGSYTAAQFAPGAGQQDVRVWLNRNALYAMDLHAGRVGARSLGG